MTLTGTIEAYDGDPVANRKLYIRHSNGGPYQETNASGEFQATVPANTGISWALYKSGSGQLHAPEKNAVPHIYPFERLYTTSSDIDIGTKTVPRGYQVNVRALHADGSPATDASFGFGASTGGGSFGSSNHWLTANQDGYLTIKNADFTGIELTGTSKVTAKIPAEDGSTRSFTESLDVDQPLTVTAQVDDGTTITTTSADDANTTTTTTTTTTTQSHSTSTRTTTQPATATTTTTLTTTTEPIPSTTATTTQEDTRGFFSNDAGDTQYEFLTDPFVLTFGGFTLSILGVLQNMVRR